MKKITYAFILFTTLSSQGAETYLNEKFTSGIPSSFTLLNLDGNDVDTKYFDSRLVKTQNTWFSASVSKSNISGGNGVVSASRRTNAETATDNWLILPKINITSENAWFRWSAHSVHHNLPESYEVVVFSNDDMSDLQVLAKIEEENYDWTARLVSLKEFTGKEIYLALRHTSTNKYLLAVDNFFVGELTEKLIEGKNTGRHFFSKVEDEGIATINGSLQNIGRPLKLSEIQLTVGDSTTYAVPCEKDVVSGETLNFEISFPVEQTETLYSYTANAVESDGSKTVVFSDYATCSHYKRTVLVEKFTGMWCNSCTAASPYMYDIEKAYGDEIAVVEVHVWGGSETSDVLYNYYYHDDMGIMNVPTIRYNRDRDKSQSSLWTNDAYVRNAAIKAVNAKIESSAEWLDDDKVKVSSKVQFNEDKNNSSNIYRIGYIIKENGISSNDYKQANNCSLELNNEFYYLPNTIPGDLMIYNKIARGGEVEETYKALGTASGIKGNLPAVIEAGTDYVAENIIELPESVTNPENVQIIAVLFVYSSVMNVSDIKEIKNYTGVKASELTDSEISMIGTDDLLTVSFAESAPYSISIYGIDGREIESVKGDGFNHEINNLQAGCYVVVAKQGCNIKTNKIIIK